MDPQDASVAKKFIEILQTHPLSEEGEKHAYPELERAAHVGLQIGKELLKAFPKKNILQNRFRTLVYALRVGNKMLRLKLIETEDKYYKLSIDDFIKMEEKDLATDEHKLAI